MQIECQHLSYDAYFKWHMRIWEEICRDEQKVIFGTVTERVFREKIQSKEINTNNATLRFGFLPVETLVTVPRFGVFRIH